MTYLNFFTDIELWKIKEDQKRIDSINRKELEVRNSVRNPIRQLEVNAWLEDKLTEMELRDKIKGRCKELENMLIENVLEIINKK